MELSDALDVKDLVIYRKGSQEEAPEVTNVREFHIAKALLGGFSKERLGHTVPSQWGPVTLFELCKRFGYVDTALALACHGVPGCTIEAHQLGPYHQRSPCCCEPAEYWNGICPGPPGGWWSKYAGLCDCSSRKTCEHYCFGWPVDKGTWMQDWDAHLSDAVKAAEEATEDPFLQGLLEMSGRGAELRFMSSDGMARLLDIAILTGDREAAAHVSRNCQVWPLRCWKGDDLFVLIAEYAFAKYSKVLIAALQAGADFESVQVSPLCGQEQHRSEDGHMPLRVALFLELEISWWKELEEFFPPSQEKWRPQSSRNDLARYFTCKAGSHYELCIDKIQSAGRAAVDISSCAAIVFEVHGACPVPAWRVSLLGLAIVSGQVDYAIECVRLGLEVSGLPGRDNFKRWLNEHRFDPRKLFNPLAIMYNINVETCVDFAATSDCWFTAHAAAMAALRFDTVEKSVATYQVLKKMLRGRHFPMEVAHSIVTFSLRVPEIVDELDLTDLVEGWVKLVPPSTPKLVTVEKDLMKESDGRSEFDQSQDAGHAAHEAGSPSGDATAEQKSTDELLRALQASRDQVPALNIDGVCVFRLSRGAMLPRVNDLLLDATGPLAALHERVLEAGCEVNPEWNMMKALFVPFTEAQMVELHGLAEHGYELNKENHILALQSDQPTIEQALKSICKKNRPKLKKAGPEMAAPDMAQEEELDEDDESEPFLVREMGLRTDSDVGMPSYPTSSEWQP